MSFLYKALLKNNGQTTPQSNPSMATMPMYADQEKASVPLSIWLLLGVLLLVVGLLTGYLFAQHSLHATINQQPLTSTVTTPNIDQPLVPLAETSLAQNNKTEAVNTLEPSGHQNTNTDNIAPVPAETASEPRVESPIDNNTITAKGEGVSPQTIPELDDNPIEIVATPSELNVGINNDMQQTEVTEQEALIEQEALADKLAIEDVPENLKAQFSLAVEATETLPEADYIESNVTIGSSLPVITELSDAEKAGIPPLYFGMHIFASNPQERWVKINNQVLKEGDSLMPGLKLLEIRQSTIVWETRYNRFIQEALEDFAG